MQHEAVAEEIAHALGKLRLSSDLAFPAIGCLIVGARGAVSGGGPAARPRLPGSLPRVPVC